MEEEDQKDLSKILQEQAKALEAILDVQKQQLNLSKDQSEQIAKTVEKNREYGADSLRILRSQISGVKQLIDKRTDYGKLLEQEGGSATSLRNSFRNIERIAERSYNDALKRVTLLDNEKDLLKQQVEAQKTLNELGREASVLEKISEGLDKEANKDLIDKISNVREGIFEIKTGAEDFKNQIDSVLIRVKEINSDSNLKFLREFQKLGQLIPFVGSYFENLVDSITEARRDELLTKSEKKQRLEDELGFNLDSSSKPFGRNIKKEAIQSERAREILPDIEKITEGTYGKEAAKKLNDYFNRSDKRINTSILGFKALKKTFSGILNPASLILGTLVSIGRAFISVDRQASNLAKTFNVTYQEALAIRKELVAAADASGELFVNSRALQETLSGLNAAAGTRSFRGLSEELQQNVVFLTKLREQAGVGAEQIQEIAQISFATGESTEEITKNLLGAANVFAARRGLIINEKDLFNQIQQFSKATLLTLSQVPSRIGEAFAEAKKLGASLQQVDGISSSLVDFQSSIRSELEAQVLTGRALNFNAARLAALNNDAAGVAREVSKQIGSAAEFGKLNRIQQQGFASAIGMSRDELAQMLLIQEQIAGLQGEEAERKKKAVNLLIQQRGIEGAISAAGDEQIAKLEKQVGVQEQFTAAVEKLKEVFVDIAAIIGPLLSGVASVVGQIAKLVSLIPKELIAIAGGIGAGALVGGIPGAVVGGIAATAGVVASQVDDGYFPPVGGEGYDRALLTPEGTFKLNNEDNLLAGTDDSLKSIATRSITPQRQPKTGATIPVINNQSLQTVSNETMSSVSSQNVINTTQANVDTSELVAVMKKSNELIEQQTKVLAQGQEAIRKQKQNLVVGATSLGTQINTNSYRVQFG